MKAQKIENNLWVGVEDMKNLELQVDRIDNGKGDYMWMTIGNDTA